MAKAKEKKPTLSPSKITTYLACPVKYRWTHIDARGRWYMKAKSYFSFGASLHRVLERFHDSGDNGVETTRQALAALEENWLEAGFSSADEMADAYGEGKAIIERYVEEHQIARAGANTLFVEKFLKRDMGDFILVGRLDRVDEHEDGTLEIVDYKSSRASVKPEDVAQDIAMSCYQLLLKEQYPTRVIKATIVSLRTGEQASYSMLAEEMDEFEFSLKELGRTMLCHDYFELVPIKKGLCVECDFLPLCKKHHEF
jgi:putative RecB family exonuclease